MSRRAVQVRITNEVLTQLLKLPSGQRVTAVIPLNGADVLHSTVRLVIEGNDLPEIPEGVEPIEVNLRATQQTFVWNEFTVVV